MVEAAVMLAYGASIPLDLRGRDRTIKINSWWFYFCLDMHQVGI